MSEAIPNTAKQLPRSEDHESNGDSHAKQTKAHLSLPQCKLPAVWCSSSKLNSHYEAAAGVRPLTFIQSTLAAIVSAVAAYVRTNRIVSHRLARRKACIATD